ncbi:hypothetical protein G6F57_003470 [Rhizopus arrhizus]|jgi:ribosomal protein S11|uniref:Ribosomal protein S11 n=3 Tax=Rhizopus TaxID=4842 RepID=I1BXB0_RHIO9|nr:hypothetical protein RO3G_05545 [Rhizopus delemar RA 99-880]KAG0743004.1 hypothetical protein G6F23_006370 [Rhizopus arrhizus]KAG1053754.1 hypothetical protein G6F43_004195 [Rhizopus delemar]KAG0761558.1 hypothetical protein G6F24_007467 [Rhizopus arrhizus]KAG0778091.1 hypothetical protein G6F22_011442 [Rhizopus arrhizus]|eukprot:EIE80840.1 hypothetical protein RO3G_05545 [Rhizopus delemar RA 99-880]
MLRIKNSIPKVCKQFNQPCLQKLYQTRWITSNPPQSTEEPSAQMEGILKVLNEVKKDSQQDGLSSMLRDSVDKSKTKTDFGLFDLSKLVDSFEYGVPPHQLHINATPNNTIVTLTRPNGSPLVTTSGGSAGFKKAARSGYEAAHQASLQLLDKMSAKNLQVSNIHIILKGFGPGRDAAFKALVSGATWNVKRITDATPVPFGGCRPKKARRL